MKVGIIGSGLVGSTAAYAMIMKGIGREIVMVDLDPKRRRAEADDLLHAVPFSNQMVVRDGEYEDLAGARLLIFCAGAAQLPGQSRLDLVKKNAEIFREIVGRAYEIAPEAVFLITTNPVDVLTQLSAEIVESRGGKRSRVLGSGTTLDTARFRALLGEFLDVDSQHVHAYVIGEHGDSEVLPWSLVTVGGIPLEEFCELQGLDLSVAEKARIDDEVRNAAYTIIEGKKATYYGIGAALARIAQAVLRDQRSILTVTHPTAGLLEDVEVAVSLPRLVGGNGVLATFPVAMADPEREALLASARTVHDVARKVTGSSRG